MSIPGPGPGSTQTQTLAHPHNSYFPLIKPTTISNENGIGLGGVKFPHTRAQLTFIARHYKPLDPHPQYEGGADDEVDNENDTENEKVTQQVVNQVVRLLGDEREDELKGLLKRQFGVDGDSVCLFLSFFLFMLEI